MFAMMQMMQMMMGGGLAPAVIDPSALPFTGAGPEASRPARLSVGDSVLLSGKALIHLAEGWAQVSAVNNIGMALGAGALLYLY